MRSLNRTVRLPEAMYLQVRDGSQKGEVMFDSLKDTAINGILFMQGLSTGGLLDTVSQTMQINAEASFMETIIENVTGPLGFVLIVIYTLAGILKRVDAGREVAIEDIIAPCIFIIVADVALSNIGTIVGSLAGISNSAMEVIHNALAGQDVVNQELQELEKESLNKCSVFELGALFMTSYTATIISLIARVVLFVVLLTAKVELILRLSFAPVGLASFADSNDRSGAVRYAKKLLAASLYAGAIMAAIYIAAKAPTYIVADIKSSPETAGLSGLFVTIISRTEAIFMNLAAPFVAIGSVSAAKAAVNEALS